VIIHVDPARAGGARDSTDMGADIHVCRCETVVDIVVIVLGQADLLQVIAAL
jgi:hypothetical protein